MICVPSKQLNRISNAYGSTGDTKCQINNFVRHIITFSTSSEMY